MALSILKFFLHISKEEQKKRLEERIQDPEKHGNGILVISKNGSSGIIT